MLRINNVSFAYDEDIVLQDINMTIGPGEHISVIGASGCGKSTLLKIVYGLLQLKVGTVHWGEQQVMGPLYNLVPGEPYMKYLAQDFDLMPFITVEENISEFLSVFYPDKLKKRTRELMEMIEMVPFAKTKVQFLSGGQQQRVALARVLAQQPELLLLDEPFGHIDNFQKNSLRRNLFDFLKKKNISCITATHDHQDILPFADRVVVLKDRHVIADENTLDLYNNPKKLYIASLFGEANEIPVNIVKSYADTKRRIIVYAHEFKVSEKSGLQVKVKKSYFKGSHFSSIGTYENQEVYFDHHLPLEKGKEVFLNISLDTLNKRLQ